MKIKGVNISDETLRIIKKHNPNFRIPVERPFRVGDMVRVARRATPAEMEEIQNTWPSHMNATVGQTYEIVSIHTYVSGAVSLSNSLSYPIAVLERI